LNLSDMAFAFIENAIAFAEDFAFTVVIKFENASFRSKPNLSRSKTKNFCFKSYCVPIINQIASDSII